jgi:hypothetical protein
MPKVGDHKGVWGVKLAMVSMTLLLVSSALILTAITGQSVLQGKDMTIALRVCENDGIEQISTVSVNTLSFADFWWSSCYCLAT